MKSRMVLGRRVRSTHGSHWRRYSRLRSTTANTVPGIAQFELPHLDPGRHLRDGTFRTTYAASGFCGFRDFEIAGVSGVSGCMA